MNQNKIKHYIALFVLAWIISACSSAGTPE